MSSRSLKWTLGIPLATAFSMSTLTFTALAEYSAPDYFTNTLKERATPIQGSAVLKKAPIDHGIPEKKEADFVHAGNRSVAQNYKNLGLFENAAGRPHLMRENAGVEAHTPFQPASVFYLAHFTDFQIVDEESPALNPTNDFMLGGSKFQGAYRPQSPYLAHTANALIDASNAIQVETRGFDLAVHTGDAIENAQKNELDAFLKLMSGGTIQLDSGEQRDLIAGPNNDPNDALVTRGVLTPVNNAVPWLSLVGNHDILSQGNYPEPFLDFINSAEMAPIIIGTFGKMGFSVPNHGTSDHLRHQLTEEQLYFMSEEGTIAGLNDDFALQDLISRTELATAFANYFNQGQVKPQMVEVDEERVFMDRCKFINAHLNNEGVPAGHGFTPEMNGKVGNECVGHYVYVPESNKQLRFVGLDTTKEYGGAEGILSSPQKSYIKDALVQYAPSNPQDPNSAKVAHLVIDPLTSVAYSSNASGMLKYPGTERPLFLLPKPQGRPDLAAAADPNRNPLTFLKTQLAQAEKNNQMVVLMTHHASELLMTHNELRVDLEKLICAQFGPQIDCDASDGTLTTGDIDAPVWSPKSKGNQQLLGFFANALGLQSFDQVNQDMLDIFFAQMPQLKDLVSAINLILSFRQILPDPHAPLTPEAFRQLVASSPNILVHLVGHSHTHKILYICPNGETIEAANKRCSSGGRGYYEVRTAANADWPIEQRLLEFVDNNNGTMSIYSSVFSAPADGDNLVALGQRLTLADAMTRPNDVSEKASDLNVILTTSIPKSVDKAFDTVSSRRHSIESLKLAR